MKKLLVLIMTVSVSANSFAGCVSLLQNKINSIDAKIKGISLMKYLALGAAAGGIGGTAVSAQQLQNRNSYIEGYNAGATPNNQSAAFNAGYQAGYIGQSTADYLDGNSNLPQKVWAKLALFSSPKIKPIQNPPKKDDLRSRLK